MSVDQYLRGNILTASGWVHGEITFTEKIHNINPFFLTPNEIKNHNNHNNQINSEHYILPGFIDLHVHGAGGKDTMEGDDAIDVIARMHAKHGTTSMLATTMTAPALDLEHALQSLAAVCQQRSPQASRVLGVHLEGPYINPEKLGAQPHFSQTGSLEQVKKFQAIAPIKLITLAPEIEGHLAMVRQLSDLGIRVQLGHTLGTYEEGVAALENGATGFTHLYNAMSGFGHRSPGMVGAALAHAQYAEIIPDLIHVHPGAIKAALRAIPHLYCVTDSTAATGMPDGEYMLGRQVVHKCLGGVRLADGTLAGSTLTMDQALRNLVSIGLTLEDASNRVSSNAAKFLGLTDRGSLQANYFADMVVLDRSLNLIAVYVEGEKIA